MRRVLALAGIALGATVLVAAPSAPAFAHNYPVAEFPVEDSTIDSQPEIVSLTTNDALLDFEGTASMDVIGPDGLHYATACATVSGATVEVPAALGTAGDYAVEWRAVSADGHPISGEFSFTWAPAAGAELAAGAAAPVCPAATTDVPSAEAGAGPAEPLTDSAANGGSDLLWVLGGVGVAAVAGLAAWLVVRRRSAD